MRLYIGGSSNDIDRIGTFIEKFDRRSDMSNVEIVSTWLSDVKKAGTANPDNISHSDRYKLAYRCVTELKTADWLWMLMPSDGHSAGAFCELGYALDRNINVCISGQNQYSSVFTSLATMRFDTDIEAFTFLRTLDVNR